MVNTYLDSALKLLDWLEKNCSLSSPLKDSVLTLKQKSRFLRTYLIYSGISEAIPFASSSVISSVELEAEFKTATDELSSLCLLPLDFEKIDSVVSCMLENVKLCEPEIRKAYAILWEQPRWETDAPLIPASSVDFIDSIMENLEGLLGLESLASMMKESVEILKEKLNYLRNFVDNTAKRSIIHKEMGAFLSHVHISATGAACFSHLCWDSRSDEVMASGMVDKLSDLLQKIKPSTSDLMDMFIGLLKASISAGSETIKTDEIASFISFLLENTVECLKDRIDSIHEEIVYLIAFLMDLPDERTEDLERISADIKAAVKEAALFQVNKVKEEQVKEMNLVISRLLQKMKLIKAEIFLLRIVDSEEDILMVHVKNNFTVLHEGLKFLRTILLIDLTETKEEDGQLLSKHVLTVASEVTSLIYSIHDNKWTDDMVIKMKLELDMLVQKIKLIRAELYLMDLQNHTANLVSPMKDQIGNLQEGLLFLGTYLMDTTDIESNIQDGKLFLVHLESVINESSSLIFLCGGIEMTEDMSGELNLSIFRLLEKIKLIKAEVILGELLRFPEFGLMVHMKDEVETLQEGVRFLRAFLMNPPKAERELILAKSEATANEAASLIFFIHYHVRMENMAFESEMKHLLSELVEKIELLKAEIKDTYLQVPYSNWYHLPQIREMDFIRDMINMLNPEGRPLALVKRQTEMLLGEFKFLESFLTDIEELYIRNEHQILKDITACIADVSWGTRYIIDLTMNRDESVWYLLLYFSFVMEDIRLIKAKVMEIYDEKRYNIGAHGVASARHLTIEDVVGVKDDFEVVIEKLLVETKKMDIVSIVGMGGLGKTTLAQRVYNHPPVVKHFPIRAWCCFGVGVVRIRELLLEILRGITAVTNSMYEMSDDELAGELRKHLIQKRYLIVLDDIWDGEALNDLRRTFPDNNFGSRILLTARMSEVALSVGSSPHSISLLSDHECWNLFQEKIFGGETLDSSFVEVGKVIIRQCQGLPLAVSLIAGLLSNVERKLSCWKQVAESLRPEIEKSPLYAVLTLVYKSLPDHLKPCFLCFGEFPEDKEIHARKLFELWIEKGLIQKTDSKTLEDVAEERLLNLTSRNLVNVSRRRSDGRIRSCRVHDLIKDLCIAMGEMCTFFN